MIKHDCLQRKIKTKFIVQKENKDKINYIRIEIISNQ